MHRLVDSQQLYYGSTEHPTAFKSQRHAAHCLAEDAADRRALSAVALRVGVGDDDDVEIVERQYE